MTVFRCFCRFCCIALFACGICFDAFGSDNSCSASLPTEYEPLEYLYSDGEQYIDTDVYLLFGDEMFFDYMQIVRGNTQVPGYGAGDIRGGGIHGPDSDVSIYGYMMSRGSYSPTLLFTDASGRRYTEHWNISTTDGKLSSTLTDVANGTEYTCSTNGINSNSIPSSFVSMRPLRLFRDAYYGNSGPIRIYDTWLKRANGDMAFNMVPARKNDVLGMYDTVSATFFTNDGSGTFTAGPSCNTYTITYSCNDGTGNTIPNGDVKDESFTASMTTNVPLENGYDFCVAHTEADPIAGKTSVFAGWQCKRDDTNAVVDVDTYDPNNNDAELSVYDINLRPLRPVQKIRQLTSDVTCTAKWVAANVVKYAKYNHCNTTTDDCYFDDMEQYIVSEDDKDYVPGYTVDGTNAVGNLVSIPVNQSSYWNWTEKTADTINSNIPRKYVYPQTRAFQELINEFDRLGVRSSYTRNVLNTNGTGDVCSGDPSHNKACLFSCAGNYEEGSTFGADGTVNFDDHFAGWSSRNLTSQKQRFLARTDPSPGVRNFTCFMGMGGATGEYAIVYKPGECASGVSDVVYPGAADANDSPELISWPADWGTDPGLVEWNCYNTNELVETTKSNGVQIITSMPANSVTCVANCTPKYTVTYSCGAGTGIMTDPNSPYSSGATVTTLASTCTQPENSVFTGWSCNGNTVAAGGAFTISSDTTCTAQYSECTACAATNASCSLTVVNNTCKYDTSCNTGYGNIQNDGAYNASCDINKYDIIYDAGELNSILSTRTDEKGKTYSEPYTLKTTTALGWDNDIPADKEFTGWSCFLDPDTPATMDPEGRIRDNADNITCIAQWADKTYTVTYDCGVGTGTPPTDPNRYDYGEYVTTIQNTTCTPPKNSTFFGWSCGLRYDGYRSGDVLAVDETFNIYDDTTCVAHYTTNSCSESLPNGYEALEYLDKLDSSYDVHKYIDTGVIIPGSVSSVNIRTMLKFPSTIPSSVNTLWGSRIVTPAVFSPQIGVDYYDKRVKVCIGQSCGGNTDSFNINTDYEIEMNVGAEGVLTRVNDRKITGPYSGTFLTDLNEFLFETNGSNSSTVDTRMYYFQYYIDGDLVFNGIPARRKSDNVLGMYDTVSREFKPSVGGGFTGGPSCNKYTVSYSCGDGGTGNPTDSNSYDYGAEVETPGANSCTKENSVLTGWSCNGTTVAAGETFSISSNTECAAQWAQGITINYKCGSGSLLSVLSSDTCYAGDQSCDLLNAKNNAQNINTYCKFNNFEFNKWVCDDDDVKIEGNVDDGYTLVPESGNALPEMASVTCDAFWQTTMNYYCDNSDEPVYSGTYDEDEQINIGFQSDGTAVKCPDRDMDNFAGWKTSLNSTNVYAKYDITFDTGHLCNNTIGYQTYAADDNSVEINQNCELSDNHKRFDGWTCDGVFVGNNVVLDNLPYDNMTCMPNIIDVSEISMSCNCDGENSDASGDVSAILYFPGDETVALSPKTNTCSYTNNHIIGWNCSWDANNMQTTDKLINVVDLGETPRCCAVWDKNVQDINVSYKCDDMGENLTNTDSCSARTESCVLSNLPNPYTNCSSYNNYEFTEWNCNNGVEIENNTLKPENSGAGLPYSDVVCTAQWKPYVTYSCNNAQLRGGYDAYSNRQTREAYEINANARIGYRKNGTQIKCNGNTALNWVCSGASPDNNGNFVVTEPVSCLAKYIITYNDEYHVCANNPENFEYMANNDSFYNSSQTAYCENNKFLGWNCVADNIDNWSRNTNKSGQNGGILNGLLPDDDITCVPRLSVKLTWNDLDGVNDAIDETKVSGASITIPADTENWENPGFDLKGWDCHFSINGVEYNFTNEDFDSQIMPPADVVCDAVWGNQTYKVIYHDDEGGNEYSDAFNEEYSAWHELKTLADLHWSEPAGKQFESWRCVFGDNELLEQENNVIRMPADNVVCTAQWSNRSYGITYTCGDGVGEDYSQDNVVYGAPVSLIENVNCSKYQHEFKSWNCKNGVRNGKEYLVDGNTECIATYKRTSCDDGKYLTPDGQCVDSCVPGDGICPDCEDGYEAKDNPVDDILKIVPTEYAYTSDDGSYKRRYSAEGVLPYGTWSAKFSYGKVTGKSVCDYLSPRACGCLITEFMAHGTNTVTRMDEPVVNLGEFNNMSCERDCAVMCADKLRSGDGMEYRRKLIGSLIPKGKSCLPKKYKITYNHGIAGERLNGYRGVMEYTNAFFGDDVQLAENKYSIDGYELDYWKCETPDNTTVNYQADEIIRNYQYMGNLVCTVQWKPKTYDIVFKPGRFGTGGVYVKSGVLTYDGEPFDLNQVDLKTAGFVVAIGGYGFVGWNTDKYADGPIANYGVHRSANDLTLYAIYKKIPTCALGQYINSAFECEPCKAGTYSNVSGATKCMACPTGTYNNTAGSTQCTPCRAGTYNDTTGAKYCKKCVDGFVSDVGASSCEQCAAGYYSNAKKTSCDICPRNTYSAAGALNCEPCDKGWISNEGAESCYPDDETGPQNWPHTDPDPQPWPNTDPDPQPDPQPDPDPEPEPEPEPQPEPEPEPQPEPEDVVVEPPVCMPGQYLNENDECESCENGTYTNRAGMSKCITCPAGSHSNVARTGCDICPPNTYSDDGTECKMCDGEYPYSNAAATSVYSCYKNVECPDVVPVENCPDNAICEYVLKKSGKEYYGGNAENPQCSVNVIECQSDYNLVGGVCVDEQDYRIIYNCEDGTTATDIIKFGQDVYLKSDICPKDNYEFDGWLCDTAIKDKNKYSVHMDTTCSSLHHITRCGAGERLSDDTCVLCDNLPEITNGTCQYTNNNTTNNCEYECSCEPGYKMNNNRCVPIQYNIVYNTNGGRFIGTPLTSYTVEDDTITLPDNVEKDDYALVGWYDNAGFNGDAITEIDTSSKENKTLYAKWEFVCESNKWIHIGDEDKLCLTKTMPETLPAVALLIDGEKYYVRLTNNSKLPIHAGAHSKWRIKIGNKTYNAHDLTVVPAN